MTSTRWLFVLVPAVVVATCALALERYMNLQRPPGLQAVVVASLVVILISLMGYLSKIRD